MPISMETQEVDCKNAILKGFENRFLFQWPPAKSRPSPKTEQTFPAPWQTFPKSRRQRGMTGRKSHKEKDREGKEETEKRRNGETEKRRNGETEKRRDGETRRR
jgi:hypothetical protein